MSTSKTARQAMNAGAVREAKADPFATNEAKIAELRKQRAAKLAVTRYDFIDALLEEYDALAESVRVLKAEQEQEREAAIDRAVERDLAS